MTPRQFGALVKRRLPADCFSVEIEDYVPENGVMRATVYMKIDDTRSAGETRTNGEQEKTPSSSGVGPGDKMRVGAHEAQASR